MELRLQKYIADCGIASRRKAEQIILEKKIAVNGKIIDTLGTKVDPTVDTILLDGKPIVAQTQLVYYMLHKPQGYVTTVSDQFNRPTVIDLLKDVPFRIFPIGRLDYETTGLLLLTNDGVLTHKLTHPKHEVKKSYIAEVRGIPTPEEIDIFEKGVIIEKRKTAPATLEIVSTTNRDATVKVTIHEGRNRQVRKMLAAIHHPVRELMRISLGAINISDLPIGKFRALSKAEIEYLYSL